MGCSSSSHILHKSTSQDNFVSTLAKPKPMALFDQQFTVDSKAELLGSGITGAVQRVTKKHTSGKLAFAVKSVNLAKYNSNQKRELLNEIAHLRELDHPSVVRLLHTFSGSTGRGRGSNVYLVLSMCAGGALSERMPRGEHRIREVLRQICSAVRYCHLKGICHRDLKTDNILYETTSDDSPVILIDFGLSKRFTQDGSVYQKNKVSKAIASPLQALSPRSTNTSAKKVRSTPLTTEIGNPWYTAPETVLGRYTEACDMWSVGVMAYQMLAGHHPFAHADGAEQVWKLLRAGTIEYDDDTWAHYSPQALSFVKALLQAIPQRRWRSDAIVNHPWFEADVGQPAATNVLVTPKDHDDLPQSRSVCSPCDATIVPPVTVLGLPSRDADSRVAEIVKAIEEFSTFGPLRRAALVFMVAHLSPLIPGMCELRDAFVEFDTDKTGLLSLSEFEQILETAYEAEDKNLMEEKADYKSGATSHKSDSTATRPTANGTIATISPHTSRSNESFDRKNSDVGDDDMSTYSQDVQVDVEKEEQVQLQEQQEQVREQEVKKRRDSHAVAAAATAAVVAASLNTAIANSVVNHTRKTQRETYDINDEAKHTKQTENNHVPNSPRTKIPFTIPTKMNVGTLHSDTTKLEEVTTLMPMSSPRRRDRAYATELFSCIDLDRSGRIRYLEFLAATMHARCIVTDAMINDAFAHLDVDKSGYITKQNLCALLGAKYSSAEVQAMIRDADVAGDGRVDRAEFFQLIKGQS